ncbi:bifunctional dttp/utp pyrophosphatase/methyltransferase protein-related [Holotrichia oblita]|nr:bifunctional dttp/utp pyrophosphatase/methyltransferase protein-related [Holotrichia oblita]
MNEPKIILASASPRRRELLSAVGLTFEVVIDTSEEKIDYALSLREIVMDLAKQKAENVSKAINNDESVIIAADTMVVRDNIILGKPKDEKDAFLTLQRLSNGWHEVYTGIVVYQRNANLLVMDYEVTRVKFRTIGDDEIKRYISSGEPMDKAGSYGIQNKGALFVERIDGDYFNVVGLPLCKLGKILYNEFSIML